MAIRKTGGSDDRAIRMLFDGASLTRARATGVPLTVGACLGTPSLALALPAVPLLLGVLLTGGMIGGATLTAAANRRQFALLFSSFDVQTAALAGALFCASIPLLSGFVAHRSERRVSNKA